MVIIPLQKRRAETGIAQPQKGERTSEFPWMRHRNHRVLKNAEQERNSEMRGPPPMMCTVQRMT